MKPIGVFNNEELYLRISKYRNNNRIYIGLETKEEPYADLTINLPDMMIPSREFVFISGDISNDLKDFLKEKGLILETFGTYQYNYGRYDMVEINFEKLKELNPQEFKSNFRSRSVDDDLEL